MVKEHSSEAEMLSGGIFEPKKKRFRNPLVPLGALVTGGAVCAGLYGLKNGDVVFSQKMMRMRVVAQGVTIVLMLGSVYFFEDGSVGMAK